MGQAVDAAQVRLLAAEFRSQRQGALDEKRHPRLAITALTHSIHDAEVAAFQGGRDDLRVDLDQVLQALQVRLTDPGFDGQSGIGCRVTVVDDDGIAIQGRGTRHPPRRSGQVTAGQGVQADRPYRVEHRGLEGDAHAGKWVDFLKQSPWAGRDCAQAILSA